MREREAPRAHALTLKEHAGHPQTVAVFEALAKGFDVEVTAEHRKYWTSMLTVGRAIDSYVDTHQPESVDTEHDLLVDGQPIPGITPEEARDFAQVFAKVTPERQAVIRAGIYDINTYAQAMRETRGYGRFHQLRTEEAELFGRVMQLDNPDEDPSIASFNTWLPRFARAGYLIDSFGDFAKDYADHIIAMRPTLTRRIRLGRTALHEAHQAVAELPPRTLGFLAAASLSKILRNGLKKK